EIARHPIGAANEKLRLAGIFEIINAAMLQKTVHSTMDRDILADTAEPWPQTTDTAHDEINFNAGHRGAVQSFDDSSFRQRVELKHDSRGQAGAGIGNFAIDEPQHSFMQFKGSDDQFLKTLE